MVEHFLGKEEVTGSNPVIGSLIAPNTTTPTVRCHCRGVLLKKKRATEIGLRLSVNLSVNEVISGLNREQFFAIKPTVIQRLPE